MHSEHSVLRLPQLRQDTTGRRFYVTLILSTIAHLIFWYQLDVAASHHATDDAAAPFAITLLPSRAPETTHHSAPPKNITATTLDAKMSLQEESTTPLEREEVAGAAQASNASATPDTSMPLSPPRHDAAYLHNPEPSYPLVARRRHLEGTVVIRAQIGIEGECLHTELQRSSGHTILDQAALDAVGQWRFVPARRGSETVVAWVDVPITFHLTETH